MNTRPDGPSDERLEGALREWGQRPPATPPGAAARLALARIRGSRARSLGLRSLVAVSSLALVLASVWLGVRMMEPPSRFDRLTVDEAPPPLPENVVLWWLDAETPVYFVTGPQEARRGELP